MSYFNINPIFVHVIAHRCSVFILAAILLITPRIALSQASKVAPNKTYTPQQVISIVLDSLQKNTDDDAGIATVFRFASPDNKLVTGPLSRFTQMIKSGYPDMLNYKSVRYEAIDISGDIAAQALWLQTELGTEYGYAFKLSKQSGGAHDGMWMTDAVISIGKNSGIAI